MTEHGPKCWGWVEETHEDRNGEPIGRCKKCGQRFFTQERNVDGADVMTLQEFDSDQYYA